MSEIPEDIRERATAIAHVYAIDTLEVPCAFEVANVLQIERERWLEKVAGLEADLDSAIVVAWGRGATEWVRLNYPKHYARLQERDA